MNPQAYSKLFNEATIKDEAVRILFAAHILVGGAKSLHYMISDMDNIDNMKKSFRKYFNKSVSEKTKGSLMNNLLNFDFKMPTKDAILIVHEILSKEGQDNLERESDFI